MSSSNSHSSVIWSSQHSQQRPLYDSYSSSEISSPQDSQCFICTTLPLISAIVFCFDVLCILFCRVKTRTQGGAVVKFYNVFIMSSNENLESKGIFFLEIFNPHSGSLFLPIYLRSLSKAFGFLHASDGIRYIRGGWDSGKITIAANRFLRRMKLCLGKYT